MGNRHGSVQVLWRCPVCREEKLYWPSRLSGWKHRGGRRFPWTRETCGAVCKGRKHSLRYARRIALALGYSEAEVAAYRKGYQHGRHAANEANRAKPKLGTAEWERRMSA